MTRFQTIVIELADGRQIWTLEAPGMMWSIAGRTHTEAIQNLEERLWTGLVTR